MYCLKNLVVILVVVCFSQYSDAAVEVVTKSQTFDDGIFFNNAESFYNGILVYAICDSNTRNLTNCKVVQENYPYKEAAYSCLVTLENNHLKGDGDLFVTVTALGDGKAVLYWRYRKLEDYSIIVNIGTVDLKTCKMNRIIVPDATSLTYMYLSHNNKFVPYSDDSFDIFYPNPKRHPEEGELYKIHIDENGRMINKPESANVEGGNYFDAMTIATRSPAKGYVFVKRNQYRSRKEFSQPIILHLLLVKPDGTMKHLAEYKRNSRGTVAAGNNFISLCYKSEDKGHIVCTQYDEYGRVIFTTTLAARGVDIDIIKSYNLLNDGMLVMYGPKSNQPKGSRNRIGYEVVWIDFDGKEKGRMHTQKSEIPKGMVATPYIYENGNKGYCATVIINNEYSSGEVPMNLNVVANCFTFNDLLV
ncbi:uncharacterized protein LOC131669903 [Phymastichus coffea]|uniref:uncharacterized protein LOC131669903 n=1 Tax=Phymastichus coffea TaxID=108790 RepID=UPI00273B4215|nr:uncharacterized protein LOC131669903 [Phymastichus coffea]